MSIEELRGKGLILLECISGSRAYGLETPDSDTDIKGVFILPKEAYYGLNYIKQVNNATNDIVFYELGRFMELLAVNNPNILELLNTPKSAIIYKHPALDLIKSNGILSKLCSNTFGKYALSQIKKAKGLKKKIVNPLPKERKSILTFCYVSYEQGAIPLVKYLELKQWEQAHCGLVKITHMKDVYGLYYDTNLGFNGVADEAASNEVRLSSVPKGTQQQALLYFNRDGYSSYCKEYQEYWDWVEKRNEERYKNTESHGKNYDAKNMIHVFRLLQMAIEIAQEQKVNVRRKDRDFLLSVKSGNFEYDELIKLANQKQEEMENAYAISSLPEKPNVDVINQLTYGIRDRLYQEMKD